jgi:hypothetical protein
MAEEPVLGRGMRTLLEIAQAAACPLIARITTMRQEQIRTVGQTMRRDESFH